MFPLKNRDCESRVEFMQMKLKTATKLKLSIEREVYNLNNTERSLCEELQLLHLEIRLVTEQLEDLKDKISENSYQIAKINIDNAAEKSKTDIYINELNHHREGFRNMFAKERNIMDFRNKELEAKQAEEQEIERLKQKEIERQSELRGIEAVAYEEEARRIEQECAVLRKRNNAVMLKLRRKLVQTEDARRELMNQQKQKCETD